MNKYLLLLCTVTLFSFTVATAQTPKAPQSFTYQAVARDASGNALVNKSIGLRMSIISNTTAVYTETFTANTNAYGMFTVTIGNGAVVTGSFAAINWLEGSASPKSLKVELDPAGGTAYVDMGTTTFNSVPYALVSDKAANMTLDNLTDVNAPTPTTNQVLQWNGTAWVPGNAGSGTVQTNTTLSGDGSSVNPLKLADQSATSGQVLQWSGTTWSPATIAGGVGDNWGTQFVQKNVTLDGNGTNASPLKIAQQGAVTGETLIWNGSLWIPGRPVISVDGTFAGQGTPTLPLKLGQQGAVNGDALRWNGTTWVPSAPFSLPYSGSGVGAVGLSTFRIINPGTSPLSLGAMYAESNGGNALEAVSNPASGKAVSGATQDGIAIFGKAVGLGLAGQFDGPVAVLGQLKVFGSSVTKASDFYFFDQTVGGLNTINPGTNTLVPGLDVMNFTVSSTASAANPAKVIFTFNTPYVFTNSTSSSGENFEFRMAILQGATIIKQVFSADYIKATSIQSFSYTMHCPITSSGSYTAYVTINRPGGSGNMQVGAGQVQIQVVNP
jgi:hypothetical protein